MAEGGDFLTLEGELNKLAANISTDPFILTVPTFDGHVVWIGAR